MRTKNELKEIIAKKIAGQGDQVDIGNALPEVLDGIIEKIGDRGQDFLSLERLRHYLYKITFDNLPEDNGGNNPVSGGCSAFVQGGKLYRNLDFKYDEAASFIVRTRNYVGMSFVTGLNDGELVEDLLKQLPYRVVDGVNNNGIKVSTHILFNDWEWKGTGNKTIPVTRIPYLVLERVKSMATIEADLDGVLDNLYAPEMMGDYLLQVLVTDGTTSYAILPATTEDGPFVLQNITANPKLANFRWVASSNVTRYELQDRPTGVERFNLMPCSLEALRFTKAYESEDRLSEFIGIDETTKDSTDEELIAIYEIAQQLYDNRQRDGKTWHTMHSVVYGDRMEQLYIQENWKDNIVVDPNNYSELAEIDNFEEYSETTNYATGDIVRHNGKLYYFTANKDAGEWDSSKVERTTIFDLLTSRLPVTASVTISALESANLSAEEAAAAGFDALTIQALQRADNPTVHFSDMCVTFNGVEVISDDLVNQSALIVHTAVGGGTLHKCILSLYTDGRIVYTVTEIE